MGQPKALFVEVGGGKCGGEGGRIKANTKGEKGGQDGAGDSEPVPVGGSEGGTGGAGEAGGTTERGGRKVTSETGGIKREVGEGEEQAGRAACEAQGNGKDSSEVVEVKDEPAGAEKESRVESWGETCEWLCYTTREEVDQLIASLNDKGVRERALKAALKGAMRRMPLPAAKKKGGGKGGERDGTPDKEKGGKEGEGGEKGKEVVDVKGGEGEDEEDGRKEMCEGEEGAGVKASEGEGQWFDRVEALPVIQSLGEVLRKLQSKVHELGGAPKPQAPIGREAKEDQESQNPATKAGEEGVAEDVKVDTGGEEKKASPPKPLQSALSVLVSKQGGGAGASRGPAGHPRKGSAAAAAADETEEVAAEWAEWASGLTAALAMAEYACNVAAEKAEEMAADSALTRCQAGSSTSLVSMGEEKGGGVKKGGGRTRRYGRVCGIIPQRLWKR